MNTFNKLLAISSLALGVALPLHGFAQATTGSKTDTSKMAAPMTDGEVKKVDQAAGKVTIKHGPIKHLDMPSMTMVFTAKDKSTLADVKPGDKVQFVVVNEGGKMLLTDIRSVQ